MAITVENESANNADAISITFTNWMTSGTGRAIIVSAYVDSSSGAVSSVTRSGDTFTSKVDVSGAEHCSIWASDNEPSTAAADLTITLTAARPFGACALSLSGVDQTTRYGNTATRSLTASTSSYSITITGTASDSLCVDAMGLNSTAEAITANSGQTARPTSDPTTMDPPGTAARSSTEPSEGSSTTMGYSWTSNSRCFACALEVFAADVTGAPSPRILTPIRSYLHLLAR